jgi:hypothetical protein
MSSTQVMGRRAESPKQELMSEILEPFTEREIDAAFARIVESCPVPRATHRKKRQLHHQLWRRRTWMTSLRFSTAGANLRWPMHQPDNNHRPISRTKRIRSIERACQTFFGVVVAANQIAGPWPPFSSVAAQGRRIEAKAAPIR